MNNFRDLLYILVFIGTPGFAYEVETHEKLSEWATERSILGDPQKTIFIDLGIVKEASEVLPEFPTSRGVNLGISELIQYGSRFEDDDRFANVRPFNHFYDPQNSGRGLEITVGPLTIGPKKSSPDWSLEDLGSVEKQNFSFADANNRLRNALTSTTQQDRNRNWGFTFQTLGHVIHHVQDMAQPQHVRNDDHCNKVILCVGNFYRPSLYEDYTKRNHAKIEGLLASNAYPALNLKAFTKARFFWDKEGKNNGFGQTEIGLAEFTSNNFVSDGTNFRGGNLVGSIPVGVETHPEFDNPPANVLQVTARNAIDQDLFGPAKPFSGNLLFVGTQVEDRYIPAQSSFNPRTSSFSIFDSDFDANDTQMNFSLNRFNFDTAHKFLIPRAVSYSAGLIDYFFRGRIQAIVTPDGDGIELTNVSKGNFTFAAGSRFWFYYVTDSDEHLPLPGLSNAAVSTDLAINQTITVTGLLSALQLASDISDSREIVVLMDGIIGEERGIAATRIFTDPPPQYIAKMRFHTFPRQLIIDPISDSPNNDGLIKLKILSSGLVIDFTDAIPSPAQGENVLEKTIEYPGLGSVQILGAPADDPVWGLAAPIPNVFRFFILEQNDGVFQTMGFESSQVSVIE